MPARRPQPPAARRPNRVVTDEDRALLDAAMSDVMPLPRANRARIDRPAPPPQPRQREADERAALIASLEDETDELLLDGAAEDSWAAPGVSRRTLVDLRRGRWVVEDSLDLHGLKREEARNALATFLEASLAARRRVVRIIHGRGRGSPGGVSILKLLSRRWLTERTGVLAFCQARPQDGGEGALQVLLRAGGTKA